MSEKAKGIISQVIGPVVDVTFDDDSQLPNIYDALEVTNNDGNRNRSRMPAGYWRKHRKNSGDGFNRRPSQRNGCDLYRKAYINAHR